MNFLPKGPHKFVYWWGVEAPLKIVSIIQRLMLIVNSRIAFTVNLRLFFTPLFGDYTLIGRFVGFVVRLFEIIFGVAVLGMLLISVLTAPIMWWLSPLFLFEFNKYLVIPAILAIYIVWNFVYKSKPDEKLKNTNERTRINAVRPKARKFYDKLMQNQRDGFIELFIDLEIKYLLGKSELLSDTFKNKILESPDIDKTQILNKAFEYAKKNKSRYIELEQIFNASISLVPRIENILDSLNSNIGVLESTADWIIEKRESLSQTYIWNDDFNAVFTGGIGKGMTGRVTPFLDSISTDFTRDAQMGKFQRYIILEKQIKKIGEILTNSHENILIIGEAGSGKTSLVRGIAYKIIEGIEYKSLNNKRVVSIDLTGIFGGTSNFGQVSEKVERAISEAQRSGDIIIFIDEIHNVIAGENSNNPGISSVYSILEPYLESGKIQFIAATNISNYRKYIEPNGSFSRLFNIVEIPEASKEETLQILKFNALELEKRYKIIVTYPALQKTVDLSQKLIQERVFPDKAVKIIDRAATSVSPTEKYLNSQVVLREISEITKVPLEAIGENEAEKILNIEDEMKKIVIGQDFAVKQVGMAIKRARAGVRNENKPIASFLFVGSTGIGKTQTAKALAKSYFGDFKAMVRLDMSEYQQIDSINRLIGTPDGKNQGMLTSAIRSKPFTLLLLDEVEKAHPSILMVFLQILDEGTATDSSGIKIDFTNTIIIATSNVGTRTIQSLYLENADLEHIREGALKDVRDHFSPELLNRFSGIIVFNPLTSENLRRIVLLLLENVSKNMKDKGITVTFKDELINELMRLGYNPEWGARPLARTIEDTVETYLATKLISKQIQSGDEIELGLEALTN